MCGKYWRVVRYQSLPPTVLVLVLGLRSGELSTKKFRNLSEKQAFWLLHEPYYDKN